MLRLGARFVRDNSGVTAIEYGLIAALVALVILTAVKSTGERLRITFEAVASSL
jgi:pilus assembly protein Flp/PilA